MVRQPSRWSRRRLSRARLDQYPCAVTDAANRTTAASPPPESVLAALDDVLAALTRPGFGLHEVMQMVIERAVQLCGADTGNIATRQGEVYRIVAFVGLGTEYEQMVRERDYVPERGTVIGRALTQRTVIHIPDVLDDPEYVMRDAQRAGGFRTLVAAPMLQDEEAIGVVAVARNSVAPFGDTEVDLLRRFAAQAGVAIRIATLLTETREALDR